MALTGRKCSSTHDSADLYIKKVLNGAIRLKASYVIEKGSGRNVPMDRLGLIRVRAFSIVIRKQENRPREPKKEQENRPHEPIEDNWRIFY